MPKIHPTFQENITESDNQSPNVSINKGLAERTIENDQAVK